MTTPKSETLMVRFPLQSGAPPSIISVGFCFAHVPAVIYPPETQQFTHLFVLNCFFYLQGPSVSC